MSNQLANSTSPYLQQHANNPVWWREWGDEAFAEARAKDLPIFLSIGYAACHWCHVMAHESFEDITVSEYLNKNFISIKVDREERPDVDSIYMQATVAMTGHGGWPMSVFLDQQLRPFFAGTYFPPEPRGGHISFLQLLMAIVDTWQNRREELDQAAANISQHLIEANLPTDERLNFDESTTQRAAMKLTRQFDPINHGFGTSPKFPPSMALEFLLRHFARTNNSDILELVEFTCYSMSRGGMYDQLAGGFARYSVDQSWTIPHFEKMLYDNALLVGVYARLYRINRKPYFKRIVEETVEWLQNEMLTAQKAFASALDADSEGKEGIFYSWNQSQLLAVLDEADANWAIDQFQITHAGTFEDGLSVLQRRKEPNDEIRYKKIKEQLLAERAKRVRPGRDDKVIVSWNCWMITNLIDAGAIFDKPEWIRTAQNALDFLLDTHLVGENLLRVSRDGITNEIPGLLEDWASLITACLKAHGATGKVDYLNAADFLAQQMIQRFMDGENFYDTESASPVFITRPRDVTDNAYPSGISLAIEALLSASALLVRPHWRELAVIGISQLVSNIEAAPRFAAHTLSQLEAYLDGPCEVALVGEVNGKLHNLIWQSPRAGLVMSVGQSDSTELLANRQKIESKETVFICKDFVCEMPLIDLESIKKSLKID
jgi:uncharacterized protein YyaL (SSP411 family)